MILMDFFRKYICLSAREFDSGTPGKIFSLRIEYAGRNSSKDWSLSKLSSPSDRNFSGIPKFIIPMRRNARISELVLDFAAVAIT